MADLKDEHDENKSLGNSNILLYKKLQAGTGMVIAGFTVLHLGNHFFMHFGYEAHNAVFQEVRKVYKSPIAETTLWASIAIHGAMAVLRYKGSPKDWPRYLFQKAGWFLLLAMPGHIFATTVLGPSAGLKQYDITWASMAARVLPYIFIPYYIVLAGSGAYHLYLGLPKAAAVLDIPELKKIPQRGSKMTLYSGLVTALAVSSALAVMGVYFRFPMAEEALLLEDAKKNFPHALLQFVKLPENGEWFSTFRLPK